MALLTRLVTIWRIRPASPSTAGGISSGRTSSRGDAFFPGRWGNIRSRTSDTASHMSKGPVSISILPASILLTVEHVVDDGHQAVGRTQDRAQVVALLVVQVRLGQQIGHAQDNRSWAYGSRDSCWPGTGSWPDWPRRPAPWPRSYPESRVSISLTASTRRPVSSSLVRCTRMDMSPLALIFCVASTQIHDGARDPRGQALRHDHDQEDRHQHRYGQRPSEVP